jgi:hypothetical protein
LLIWIRILLFLPTVGNKVFHNCFIVGGRIRILMAQKLTDPDPAPGSVSGTLTHISGITVRCHVEVLEIVHCFFEVLEAKPWGLSWLADLFWGFISFMTLFFKTLIDPDLNKKGQGYATDYRSTGTCNFCSLLYLPFFISVTIMVRIRILIRGSFLLIMDSDSSF